MIVIMEYVVFGSTAHYISGNITVEILDLNTFKPENQSQIHSYVEGRTDKLKINVRSGMLQSKVEAILLKLASQGLQPTL